MPGPLPLKAFMSESGIDDFKRVDDDVLFAGLLRAKELGTLVGVHAENEYVTQYLARKIQGHRSQRPSGLARISPTLRRTGSY